LFLRLQRYCALEVRSPGSNCQPEVLPRGFAEIEGEYLEEESRSLTRRWLVLPSWQRAGSYRPLRDAVFD
jgi:hypothetical protein